MVKDVTQTEKQEDIIATDIMVNIGLQEIILLYIVTEYLEKCVVVILVAVVIP